MKIKEKFKRKLREPENMGVLMQHTKKTSTTLYRWIKNDYKDLRLPENVEVLESILQEPKETIFYC